MLASLRGIEKASVQSLCIASKLYTENKSIALVGESYFFSFATSSRKQRLRFHGCPRKKKHNEKKKNTKSQNSACTQHRISGSLVAPFRPSQIGIALTSIAIVGKSLGMVVVCRVKRRCHSPDTVSNTSYVCSAALLGAAAIIALDASCSGCRTASCAENCLGASAFASSTNSSWDCLGATP
jgi:hypothetical protein